MAQILTSEKYFPVDNSILQAIHKWNDCLIMIHKSNKRKDEPSIFRPIIHLRLVSKLLELLILRKHMAHISHLLFPIQFRFRAHRSFSQYHLHRVIDTLNKRRFVLGYWRSISSRSLQQSRKTSPLNLLCISISILFLHIQNFQIHVLSEIITGFGQLIACTKFHIGCQLNSYKSLL